MANIVIKNFIGFALITSFGLLVNSTSVSLKPGNEKPEPPICESGNESTKNSTDDPIPEPEPALHENEPLEDNLKPRNQSTRNRIALEANHNSNVTCLNGTMSSEIPTIPTTTSTEPTTTTSTMKPSVKLTIADKLPEEEMKTRQGKSLDSDHKENMTTKLYSETTSNAEHATERTENKRKAKMTMDNGAEELVTRQNATNNDLETHPPTNNETMLKTSSMKNTGKPPVGSATTNGSPASTLMGSIGIMLLYSSIPQFK